MGAVTVTPDTGESSSVADDFRLFWVFPGTKGAANLGGRSLLVLADNAGSLLVLEGWGSLLALPGNLSLDCIPGVVCTDRFGL